MEDLYGRLKILERKNHPFSEDERISAAAGPLLFWYKENRRSLPWREDPAPYRVWISEIMLQQTRVEAVKPYFERFMKRLPDVRALAQVEDEVLLKLWEGLGYYNRARNLKKAAQMMADEHKGELPPSYKALLELPGIGSYTAGAIASIAFGIPEPAVDGNVLRVISRLLESREDIGKQSVKRQIEDRIRSCMDRAHPGDYNQALIELGALVCIPAGAPLCGECPLSSLCLACRSGSFQSIPVKAKKKARRIEEKTVFLIEYQDKAAIRKRRDGGLLASLYEFPNVPGHIREDEIAAALSIPAKQIGEIKALPEAVHVFSHVEWHMTGYRVQLVSECPGLYPMTEKGEIFEKYPLPTAFSVYTNQLK